MKTLKKISLTSVDKHDTLSDKAMKNVMGGYYLLVTCVWADTMRETGLCGSSDPVECRAWCASKYPPDWFGEVIGFYIH